MKNYLLIFIFNIVVVSSYAQIYVTPSGGGDGTSWDSPTTIAGAATGYAGQTIYMQEGTFRERTLIFQTGKM